MRLPATFNFKLLMQSKFPHYLLSNIFGKNIKIASRKPLYDLITFISPTIVARSSIPVKYNPFNRLPELSSSNCKRFLLDKNLQIPDVFQEFIFASLDFQVRLLLFGVL